MEFYGIYMRAVSQEALINLIQNMCSEIALLKLLPYFPGMSQ